ncbi:MAG: DUF3761 domain-containing protein [Acetobacter sp.]|uniref:DUF3761 domain-containing protein n=1 Tax=Acetobacter sp. TaxID=440 RepID=UPI003D06B471
MREVRGHPRGADQQGDATGEVLNFVRDRCRTRTKSEETTNSPRVISLSNNHILGFLWLEGSSSTDSCPVRTMSLHNRDGTYSFSLHRRGTCTGHGGVEAWLGT